MTFIIALIIVILVGWLAKYVIALLTAPVGFLLIFAVGIDEEHPVGFRRPHLFIPMTIIANLYNSYVMTAWAAFCVYFTMLYIQNNDISHAWIYYILGFMACGGTLSQMARNEDPNAFATNLAIIVAPISFIIFAIWPVGIYYLHWWWLGLLS